MIDTGPQLGLLWIRCAHEAIEATTALLTAIAPQWEFVRHRSYFVELMPNEAGYKQASAVSRAAWLQPAPDELERELAAESCELAALLTPAEEAELRALPLPFHEHEARYAAHRAACEASACIRRPHMQLSGEYLYLKAGQGPDLLLRNENQATLQALLRAYWEPVAWGESDIYAIGPASHCGGGLASWLQHAFGQEDNISLLRQYLGKRRTLAARGLEIYCEDGFPDWDGSMGVLMLFATPALALMHMQRLEHDARVQWWPNLATAEARFRQPDWPPNQRVQLCPFDLRRDKVWEGDKQVCLLR